MQRIAIDMDDVMAETALHIINKINKLTGSNWTKESAGKSHRSEERRVGKECSDECISRWSPYH